ncbi:ArnT family glycosyltransferase [Candidatus Protochlamydia amoebophila]|nr:glycosyltransferase family 39 protein [Candidatus Protochlamydia amoebophila]
MSLHTYYFKRLIWVLIAKTCFIVGFIIWGGVGLGPDEAQYWTWSQKLDWGYYSKPPGVAWQIWLGTQLWGQTELGIRFFSLIWSFLQSYLVFVLALEAGLKPRTAFWSGIVMAFSPIGLLGSFLAITDGGCLIFWTLACIIVVRALRKNLSPSPFLVGLCLMAGALFKWPIYFFWVFFLISQYLWFPQLSLTRLVSGICVSLMGLLPSFWWNISHDWATFRHVFSTLQGGHGATGGNFFEFLGVQALLISPILFGLLLYSWFYQAKKMKPTPLIHTSFKKTLLFCGGLSLICLACALGLSLFQKIQGNWIVFAYPTAIVWLAGFACEGSRHEKWLKLGVATAGCLVLSLFSFPLFYQSQWRPIFMTYKWNPFKHNMGWDQLEQSLLEAKYNPLTDFLVSDKYQTTSILSFYGPLQQRAYFLNLHHARQNQFSYWPSMVDDYAGKTGYFIWMENQPYLERDWKKKLDFYQNELKNYFKHVELMGLFPLLYENQKVVKGVFIFRCTDCKSNPLPSTQIF